ncbi:MAG: type II secretion system F family protein [Candidatus Eisenbacteria sp.]|nr:type II secretion system F family protein [Candidatus Eisenbacteria bacterium]
MSRFVYRGRNATGEALAGELVADTAEAAVAQLRRQRIVATHIQPKKSSLSLRFKMKPKIKGKDLAVFTRQFSTMINSGLPLVQCLEILSKQTSNSTLREVIVDVTSRVEAGASLADALAKRPEAFDTLFVNMVDAGEAGGILDNILMRLATYIEKAEALKRKVIGAMTYPGVVFAVALMATLFMLLFIIPVFAKVFSDYGGQLPLPTRIVVGVSEMLRACWWALGGLLVVAVLAVKRTYRSERGRRAIDGFLLRAPIVGEVLRKSSIARFTRTLGTMITSGVPILASLEVTARTAGNKVIEEAVLAARTAIRGGETIAGPLAKSDAFPPMVVQMIAVGEETGALDTMLEKIADFYDDEVTAAVEALTSVIEPVMIVLMGALVGGMTIAMYLPMFKLVNVIGGS